MQGSGSVRPAKPGSGVNRAPPPTAPPAQWARVVPDPCRDPIQQLRAWQVRQSVGSFHSAQERKDTAGQVVIVALYQEHQEMAAKCIIEKGKSFARGFKSKDRDGR